MSVYRRDPHLSAWIRQSPLKMALSLLHLSAPEWSANHSTMSCLGPVSKCLDVACCKGHWWDTILRGEAMPAFPWQCDPVTATSHPTPLKLVKVMAAPLSFNYYTLSFVPRLQSAPLWWLSANTKKNVVSFTIKLLMFVFMPSLQSVPGVMFQPSFIPLPVTCAAEINASFTPTL